MFPALSSSSSSALLAYRSGRSHAAAALARQSNASSRGASAPSSRHEPARLYRLRARQLVPHRAGCCTHGPNDRPLPQPA